MTKKYKILIILLVFLLVAILAYPAWIAWQFYHRKEQISPFEHFGYESSGSYINIYALSWPDLRGELSYDIDSNDKQIIFRFDENANKLFESRGILIPREQFIWYSVCYKNSFWDKYCTWPVK